jgi:hypothetical protein
MTMPKNRNIRRNPIQAAGGFRRVGSGGMVDAADTATAISVEQRQAYIMVRVLSIATG